MTAHEWFVAAVPQLLDAGVADDEAMHEARLLLRHTMHWSREDWYLQAQQELSPDKLATANALLSRRLIREPLAYIIGERAFYGRTFTVTPAVLIPRPETEHLVEAAVEFLCDNEIPETPYVADIGTGSGCVAITLALELPGAPIVATDISDAALAVARSNAEALGADVTFLHGDLLAPLPADLRFTVIVSNPPYIAAVDASSLAPEVGVHEPAIALFDQFAPSAQPIGDGLAFYRRLAADAPSRLLPGGGLLVEVGAGQAQTVANLFTDVGLIDPRILPDLAGTPRIVTARTRP